MIHQPRKSDSVDTAIGGGLVLLSLTLLAYLAFHMIPVLWR